MAGGGQQARARRAAAAAAAGGEAAAAAPGAAAAALADGGAAVANGNAPGGDLNRTSGKTTKWSKRLRFGLFAAALCLPAAAVYFALEIDARERRSIAISFAMSCVAFVATVKLIPVAVPYVLRRNMFGFDINKRGSSGGEIKM